MHKACICVVYTYEFIDLVWLQWHLCSSHTNLGEAGAGHSSLLAWLLLMALPILNACCGNRVKEFVTSLSLKKIFEISNSTGNFICKSLWKAPSFVASKFKFTRIWQRTYKPKIEFFACVTFWCPFTDVIQKVVVTLCALITLMIELFNFLVSNFHSKPLTCAATSSWFMSNLSFSPDKDYS